MRFISCSPVSNTLLKHHLSKNLKKKVNKLKALYNLYKKILECEGRIVDTIHMIDGKIEKQNKIQEKKLF